MLVAMIFVEQLNLLILLMISSRVVVSLRPLQRFAKTGQAAGMPGRILARP
jgi:hypothetical protein